MTITLDTTVWHVRWFLWSVRIWRRFCGYRTGCPDDLLKSGTNRCFYIRVTLVWAPLVLLLHALVAFGVVASLTYLPYKLFGALGVPSVWLALALCYGAKCWVNSRPPKPYEPKSSKPATSSPGYFAMLLSQIGATLCPRIEFKSDKDGTP